MAQQSIKRGENDGPVFVLIPEVLKGRRTFWWLGLILGGIVGYFTAELLFDNVIFGTGFGLAIGATLGWGIPIPRSKKNTLQTEQSAESDM